MLHSSTFIKVNPEYINFQQSQRNDRGLAFYDREYKSMTTFKTNIDLNQYQLGLTNQNYQSNRKGTRERF